MEVFVKEIQTHLKEHLIPFWKGLMDEELGGYYGYMDYDLKVDKTYEKGCILNSRILWFFSNAYTLMGGEDLKFCAEHAYRFLKEHCLDEKDGGVFWSVTCDGKPLDTTKHTYNQAFAVYALSSYYDAVKEKEALALAKNLVDIIESKCTDEYGYLEAFDREFHPVSNEKLSENGVLAEKTMNTLLHVFEAYTEYYRVTKEERVRKRLCFMLDLFGNKVYDRDLGRQEVFFDKKWKSLINLYSYGHDIESSWLIDRGLEVLEDRAYTAVLQSITSEMAENIYNRAYVEHSVLTEAENEIPDTNRVWWVQAEAIVGFINAWQKHPEETKYLEGAKDIWEYIKMYFIDSRSGSEWFWSVDEKGGPKKEPIVEPWKCPYHNGRMCMEVLRRMKDVA